MNFGLFTHIILIGVTVFIGFVYIRPTLGEISVTQDKIHEHKMALEQAKNLNATLQALINKKSEIPDEGIKALFTYMPDTVDDITVLKDIENVVSRSGLFLVNIGTEGVPNDGRGDAQELIEAYSFNISLTGEYDKFKQFLGLIEQSDYPLHVTSMAIDAKSGSQSQEGVRSEDDGSVLDYSLTIESYSLVSNLIE